MCKPLNDIEIHLRENWYVRCESTNFLILTNIYTNQYENMYADNTKESRAYLAYLANEVMFKHPAIREEDE